MTAPTLATADVALYTALSALQCTTTGPTDALPFALVGRFVGDLAPDVVGEALTGFPAALLRFDGEQAVRDVDVVSGDSEERGAAQWTVLVGVEEPRSLDDVVQGATGVPGALACVGKVIGACNALRIAGSTSGDAWHWRRVRYLDTRPALVRRGSLYVYAVRFELLRVCEQATTADTSVNLTKIHGDVNLVDDFSTPVNPAVELDAATP